MDKAPLVGVIDGEDVVGYLGYDGGGIVEAKGRGGPDELPGAIVLRAQPRNPLSHIRDVPAVGVGRLETRFGRRLVCHCLQVQCPELATLLCLYPLVKALACLVAQPCTLHHGLDEGSALDVAKFLAIWVVRDGRVEVAIHVGYYVEADQVVQSKRGRLGVANERTREEVDLFHAVPVFQSIVQRVRSRDRHEAVGDEIGRVLADHHPLAQRPGAERTH